MVVRVCTSSRSSKWLQVSSTLSVPTAQLAPLPGSAAHAFLDPATRTTAVTTTAAAYSDLYASAAPQTRATAGSSIPSQPRATARSGVFATAAALCRSISYWYS